ncbi:MAG: glutamine-hydrolyzing GMP synthase, partial [bacterium]
AAVLVNNAAPGKVYSVFVDNGLLRKGEREEVERTFSPIFGDKLIVVDAQKEFYNDLKGVKDPELKRRKIGRRFIEVFKRTARSLPKVGVLIQGTLYPDVIESAVSRGPADVIKSHHNVGGMPRRIGFKLIEPLRDLFKDEVRRLGEQLGLPKSVLTRHPFPGPGLAVRIVGEVTPEAVKILQDADAIFREELLQNGYHDQVSQAFAVLLPVRSVGVMGDSRTYERVIVLRAVNTLDFMTARVTHLPWEFLEKVATRIANQVRGVNRVVYDITSKPPATVEWE